MYNESSFVWTYRNYVRRNWPFYVTSLFLSPWVPLELSMSSIIMCCIIVYEIDQEITMI